MKMEDIAFDGAQAALLLGMADKELQITFGDSRPLSVTEMLPILEKAYRVGYMNGYYSSVCGPANPNPSK